MPSFSYDIKEIYRDATRTADPASVDDPVVSMVAEIRRLHEEIQRLQDENRALREEVTLGRLRNIEILDDVQDAAVSRLSPETQRLYVELKTSFTFVDLFKVADGLGMSGTEAKEHLRLLLREQLLIQKGSRIEKLTPVSVQPGAKAGPEPIPVLRPPVKLPFRPI